MTYDPPESVRQWVRQNNYGKTFQAHLEYFNDYIAEPKIRKKYTDLDAAFRNCLRADWGGIRAQAGRHNGGHPQVSTLQAKSEPKRDETPGVPMPAGVRAKLENLLGKMRVPK